MAGGRPKEAGQEGCLVFRERVLPPPSRSRFAAERDACIEETRDVWGCPPGWGGGAFGGREWWVRLGGFCGGCWVFLECRLTEFAVYRWVFALAGGRRLGR